MSPIRAEDIFTLDPRYNALDTNPHASGGHVKTVSDLDGFLEYMRNDLIQAQHGGDLKPVSRGAGRDRDRR
jgi:hypothetical protein